VTDPTVRVEGLDQLVRTMRKAGEDLGALKDAHAAVGRMIAAQAQAYVPRRTGALAGTIRAARQARKAMVVAGRTSVPYAGPIHWGWPSRGIAADPFLSNAATDTESRWVPIYLKDVQAAVDQVKGA